MKKFPRTYDGFYNDLEDHRADNGHKFGMFIKETYGNAFYAIYKNSEYGNEGKHFMIFDVYHYLLKNKKLTESPLYKTRYGAGEENGGK